MLTLDSIPKITAGIVGRQVKDEAILVMPKRGQVKVLNAVGASIWRLCDGQRSVRQIARSICAEYEVEPKEAEADTLAFFADLLERGIVALED